MQHGRHQQRVGQRRPTERADWAVLQLLQRQAAHHASAVKVAGHRKVVPIDKGGHGLDGVESLRGDT